MAAGRWDFDSLTQRAADVFFTHDYDWLSGLGCLHVRDRDGHHGHEVGMDTLPGFVRMSCPCSSRGAAASCSSSSNAAAKSTCPCRKPEFSPLRRQTQPLLHPRGYIQAYTRHVAGVIYLLTLLCTNRRRIPLLPHLQQEVGRGGRSKGSGFLPNMRQRSGSSDSLARMRRLSSPGDDHFELQAR